MPAMQLRQPAPMANTMGGTGLGIGGPMGGSSVNRMAGSNSPAPISGGGNYNPMASMGQAPRGQPMGNYDAFSGLGAGSTSTRGGIPQQQYPGRGPMGQQQQQQQQRR